ncbi:hypothetical protein OAM67_00455 [bacterium]|nr:hypothetical protein [bacterium]
MSTFTKKSMAQAPQPEKQGRTSVSMRAKLKFPARFIQGRMRKDSATNRVGTGAGIAAAAAVQCVVRELFDILKDADLKHKRITPRDIYLAIQKDTDLKRAFGNSIVPGSGVVPCIYKVLLNKKNKNYVKATQFVKQSGPTCPAPVAE